MQVEPKVPAFADFLSILNQADSITNPAEIHGVLCGLICTGQKLNGNFWLHSALKLFESRAHISGRYRDIVLDLYDSTCRQLSGVDTEFHLLLPMTDEKTLSTCAEALSIWCQGFLYGLQFNSATFDEELSDEVTEALRCITELAKLDFSHIEVSEIDKVAYLGVADFVKSSAVLIYEEFSKHLSGKPVTLH